MTQELQTLEVEEEMMMRKFYELMSRQRLNKKMIMLVLIEIDVGSFEENGEDSKCVTWTERHKPLKGNNAAGVLPLQRLVRDGLLAYGPEVF
uniref:Uncharacterized protein At2g23040 n=1 Tax=Arabidopsis thaliana TaxID=3702 RepID=O64813_ARATH|nr:hypothetical protein [Arabidopsis thaliana]